jgi:hypothetical protein
MQMCEQEKSNCQLCMRGYTSSPFSQIVKLKMTVNLFYDSAELLYGPNKSL